MHNKITVTATYQFGFQVEVCGRQWFRPVDLAAEMKEFETAAQTPYEAAREWIIHYHPLSLTMGRWE